MGELDQAAIARIARTLTKPQIDAINRGSIGDHSMLTVRALRQKGLMHLRIESPNGRYGFVVNTPLGDAVRDFIAARTKEAEANHA